MYLRLNDHGTQVQIIQSYLITHAFPNLKASGIFDKDTEFAVEAFQLANGLNQDGVVGPITRAKMGIPEPKDVALTKAPHGLKEIEATFGDPLQSGFAETYIKFCEVPKELAHCFKSVVGKKNGFYCHKLIIPIVQKTLQDIVDAKLGDKLHTFDGCFNIRKKRGSPNMSVHSFGVAIDLNASENPLGMNNPPMDKGVIKIFNDNGFTWGGIWSRPDGMHFQYASGY